MPNVVSITSVTCTDLFVGAEQDPRQVLRVEVEGPATEVTVAGPGISGTASGSGLVEVPLEVTGHAVGDRIGVTVHAGEVSVEAEVEVAEPGWTMYMVSHFHYDPVWWNTQASYTAPWDLVVEDGSTRPPFEKNAYALIDLHTDLALRDPAYKFVLAEIDYLKPYLDQFPERRAQFRELMSRGQLELMGGTYNEPSTNLTGAEATIRNIVYGIGYQRDILGGDPRTAWQLDVFGHDPQFPGLLDAAGLTASAWARGPFHQWGPIQKNFGEAKDDARVMQFPSEFEWISPSGRGVLTHYMPHHYSAGWWMDDSADLATAEQAVYAVYRKLKPVGSTKNLLLMVGTDYTPPNRWVLEIHRDWAQRYVWPRFECALPRDFLDAVRSELESEGRRPSPQSRDMNPVYTGKDVSFIDTKQAQRACEVAVVDAEKLATLATLQGLGRYPGVALDKVWRQIAYGAHHDAITGSESDQVYLDLLTGWREAYDLANGVLDASLSALLGRIDAGDEHVVTVFNTLSFDRSGLVSVRIPEGGPMAVVDESGEPVPCAVERGTLRFYAHDVPALGWRTWRLVAAPPTPMWTVGTGFDIENARYRVTVDPARGGGVTSVYDLRYERELMHAGQVGNELRVYEEYPQHPDFGEGPWHLVPKGLIAQAADTVAEARREVGPLGERLIVTGTVDGIAYEQTVTLWRDMDRVDCRTRLLDFAGADRMLRLRFPVDLPGALPISEVADAVIGRGFALPEADVAEAPWTLDNPANTWFGLGSTARVELTDANGRAIGARALGIAEVVVPTLDDAADARELVVALARVGVTATTSAADWARYGWLEVDSNLPDFRVLIGDPESNPATREVLESAGEDYAAALKQHGRVWIPAHEPLREVWKPNADLRDLRALPVLVVATEEVAALTQDVADARVSAVCPGAVQAEELLTDHTVALLTKGLPSFAVDPSGALFVSLMRSCTGWPSAGWVDPPRRTMPDEGSFQLQHWTHEFEYALVSGDGDWRALALPAEGQEFNHPLYAAVPAGDVDPAASVEDLLPPTWSALRITPQRQVLLGALKPTGNPIASGSTAAQDPANGVTLRLVESTGLGREATVRGSLKLDGLRKADLLETRHIGDACVDQTVSLAGSEIATVTATAPLATHVNDMCLGQEIEIAQPVHARYWLHNRGPAPMGFLPVSVGVTPGVTRTDGEPVELSVVLASQLTDASASGIAEIIVPEGWQTSVTQHAYELVESGYARFPVTVTPPVNAAAGDYYVSVRTTYDGQQIEDVATVAVRSSETTGLVVKVLNDSISLRAGERTQLKLLLTNPTHSEIRGEIQVVAPHDVWSAIPNPTRGFAVAPGAQEGVLLEISGPEEARVGTYWLLPKVMWFGRCHYGAAIPLHLIED